MVSNGINGIKWYQNLIKLALDKHLNSINGIKWYHLVSTVSMISMVSVILNGIKIQLIWL